MQGMDLIRRKAGFSACASLITCLMSLSFFLKRRSRRFIFRFAVIIIMYLSISIPILSYSPKLPLRQRVVLRTPFVGNPLGVQLCRLGLFVESSALCGLAVHVRLRSLANARCVVDCPGQFVLWVKLCRLLSIIHRDFRFLPSPVWLTC